MKRIYTVISLTFGLIFNLTFILIFYLMLINGTSRVILDANSIGEYWFEFFLIQFSLILNIVVIYSEIIKHGNEVVK